MSYLVFFVKMIRSPAFALPVLHCFGLGFRVLRLREREFSRTNPRFNGRCAGFGEYPSRMRHTILSHRFTNSWQRIIFDLHCVACAPNRWTSASVLIDLARD